MRPMRPAIKKGASAQGQAMKANSIFFQNCDGTGQVRFTDGVYEKTHVGSGQCCRGEGDGFFSRHPGGVFNRLRDILRFQVRIVLQDLAGRLPCRQQIQDLMHWEAHSPDAGLSRQFVGLNGDSREFLHDGNKYITKQSRGILVPAVLTASLIFSLTIGLPPAYAAPPVIVSPAGNSTVTAGDAMMIPFQIDDPDNDVVDYFVEYLVGGVVQGSLPRGAILVMDPYTAEHNLFWQPALNQPGTYSFRFRAVDAPGASAERTITVSVLSRGNTPAISVVAVPYYSFHANGPFELPGVVLRVNIGDRFELQVTAQSPVGSAVTLSGNGGNLSNANLGNPGNWTWFVGSNAAGIYPATITATDSQGRTTVFPFTIDGRHTWDGFVVRYGLPTFNGVITKAQPLASSPTVVRGSAVAVNLSWQDRDSVIKTDVTGVSLQYLHDGQPIGPVLPASSYSYTWNSITVPDRTHFFSVRMIDGPADVDRVVPKLVDVLVNTVPGAVTGPEQVPLTGEDYGNFIIPPVPDWITYSGQREHSTVHPYPLTSSPPASTLPDPSVLLNQDRWFIHPLTQTISGLFQPNLDFFTTPDGHIFTTGFYSRNGLTAEGAVGYAERHALTDGGRNDNGVSPYSSFVPNPDGPGWVGVDISGRVFRVEEDGSVRTLVGRVTSRDVVPYYERDLSISTPDLYAHQKITLGSFANGQLFNMPDDLAFDPRDHSILYIADTLNHRIAKVSNLNGATPVVTTYAGTFGVEGYADGAASQAKFNSPYSIVAAPDGTLYVADRNNKAVRKISPNGIVTTLVGANNPDIPSTTVVSPQVIRFDSKGNIIVGDTDNPSGITLYRIDLASRQVVKIQDFGLGSGGSWIWLDVDTKGNVGPRDDILVAITTGFNNTFTGRVSADGSRSTRFLGNGNNRTTFGVATGSNDGMGHYPWAIAIDDQEARVLGTGFGSMGVAEARPLLTSDPVGYDSAAYVRGHDIYWAGTVPGFEIRQIIGVQPLGPRPSFIAIHGPAGVSRLGNVPNFDDLALLSDAQIAAYIQSGMGGSVPRPEVTGNDLRALIYFIRKNSLQGATQEITPGPLATDTRSPEIRNVTVIPQSSTSIRVTWQTDEPTLGEIQSGVTDYYIWFSIEGAYSKDHSVLLTGLPAGRTIYFVIRAKDEAGNQTMQQGLFGSGTPCLKGDVNGDGAVTLADATKLIRILLGQDPAPDPGTEAFCRADCNSDKVLSIADVLCIINLLLGR